LKDQAFSVLITKVALPIDVCFQYAYNKPKLPNCNDNGVLGVHSRYYRKSSGFEAVKMVTGIGEILKGNDYCSMVKSILSKLLHLTFKPENLKLDKLQKSYGGHFCFKQLVASMWRNLRRS